MLPAGCSRGLVAELQHALDTCAERQRELEQSLRVSLRLLRAWDPADSPAPEATPGCKPDQETLTSACTPSPRELEELQLLTLALEKAARVRRLTSRPAAKDRALRQKVGCIPAPGRAGLGAAGSKPPRGSRQPPLPSSTAEYRPPLASPAETSAPQAFTLKDKGTLLQLPAAFRTAASANSRLWAELNSQASGPADAVSARAQFLRQMPPATDLGSEPCAAEVQRLRKACSLLRLRLGQELAAGPAEPRQEYQRLLTLEGLRDAAGGCQRRLQELRAAAAEPWPERTAAGGSPRGGGNAQPPWDSQLLVYSSPRELQTLAALRLRVAMLDQELHLQEVLMAQLLPVLRAQQPSGSPGLVLYRAAHSLLCEGGERFVSTLRDDPTD
ncbi:tubulin epsilon and delta complex protein 2 [Sorex fumeus]|uniref:tubulin epsilon and delta complex protein 2 n=1 Tax=Sorex fumeus TaxID=62283 RepID=UPI0024AE8641|nr:tubulin epsilon and delta complex protein 2 [Sorex fumeus]